MEKLKIIIPVLLLAFSSCIDRSPRYEDVNACFVVSETEHFVNEAVSFVDCSQYAEEYEWNFGDGTSSNQRNPVHTFTEPGTYQVRLTAYGYDSMESFTDAVTVLDIIPTTDLDILVMYVGTEDPVSTCDVQLYDDFDNWVNLVNPVSEVKTTGTEGIVVFYDVDPKTYFIDVYKFVSDTSYYMNYDGETLPLTEGVVNYYNVYVEYTIDTGKSSERKRFYVKEAEVSTKEEHDKIVANFLSKQ